MMVPNKYLMQNLTPCRVGADADDAEQESWFIDLKDEGNVGKGEKNADVRLVMKDEMFQQLAKRNANAQYIIFHSSSDTFRSLFMQGKIQIQGILKP